MTSILRLGPGYRIGQLFERGLRHPTHLVLSACDSGLTGTRLPDEAIGPATVLIAAGARSVTAALWPVDDQLAPGFMQGFHHALCHGLDPAEALAHQQRVAVSHGDSAIVWSTFVHYGP